MIQTVIEYDLERFGTGPGRYDFTAAERQLSWQFAELEPGAMVRLKVHDYMPFPGYTHCQRNDIILQIISTDASVAKAWRQVFEPEATLDY